MKDGQSNFYYLSHFNGDYNDLLDEDDEIAIPCDPGWWLSGQTSPDAMLSHVTAQCAAGNQFTAYENPGCTKSEFLELDGKENHRAVSSIQLGLLMFVDVHGSCHPLGS